MGDPKDGFDPKDGLKGRVPRSYWDSLWKDRRLYQTIDPHRKGLSNYAKRCFHRFFYPLLSNRVGQSLLEVGCAGSLWLPYFAKEFQLKVTGLDYSPLGCRQAEEILADSQINGKIVEADFFNPPPDMLNFFHVVISLGVIEHFNNTSDCINSLAKFLRTDGILITEIPNMIGLIGSLQRFLDPKVYRLHVPLSRNDLKIAHEHAGLSIHFCDYFMFFHLGVLNIESWQKKHPFLGRILSFLKRTLTGSIWLLESLIPFLKSNSVTSPYILCVAKKENADKEGYAESRTNT